MKPSKQILKRMRPALGTFVEIGLEEHSKSPQSFDLAFAAIEKVEALMSFHRPSSEVSRINSLKMGESFTLHSLTHSVLEAAEELKLISQGIFNVAIGAQLTQWNLLPSVSNNNFKLCKTPFILRGHQIHRVGPGLIDLGGIAKGFAVDEAVKTLKTLYISGYVNAGGDVRVFGGREFPFMIQAQDSFYKIPLHNKSLATSSVRRKYLEEEKKFVSFHVNPELGEPCLKKKTVSIIADSCIIADSLTKVALMANEKVLNHCLKYFKAHAVVFDSHKCQSFLSQGIDENSQAV